MTLEDLAPFLAYCRSVALEMRNDANESGIPDYCAYRLIDTIDALSAGLQGTVPLCLSEHYEKFLREQDPEWAEYKRLQVKFGKA